MTHPMTPSPNITEAVVAAFEDVLGRGLLVPKHREVLGAYGAAISLQEKMAAGNKTRSMCAAPPFSTRSPSGESESRPTPFSAFTEK